MKKEFGYPLSLASFKGRIHPEYNHTAFIGTISDCHRLLREPSCEVLLDGRNRIGAISLPAGDGRIIEVVIKEFRSFGWDRLKSAFVAGKAFKAWRGGTALLQGGILTPLPLAYLERRKSLFLDQGFFLTERIKEAEEIRFLFRNLSSKELNQLLEALASYLSHCHKKGIFHRDLSDGNILVKKDPSGKFLFYLIDTNRIRQKQRIGLFRGVKNLIRLGIPSDSQRFFLKHYLKAARVRRHLWFWYRVNKAAYTWYVELKKKLRLKQISRRLKIQ